MQRSATRLRSDADLADRRRDAQPEAVVDRLIPAGGGPGALVAGAAEYIDGFLGAFMVDPPRIWAGGPTSGRFGGPAGYPSSTA